MVNDRNPLSDITPCDVWVRTAKRGQELLATAKGTLKGQVSNSEKWTDLRLENVFFVQDLDVNLFSVEEAISLGATILFQADGVVILSKNTPDATGQIHQTGLYYFSIAVPMAQVAALTSTAKLVTPLQLHQAAGHISQVDLIKSASKGMFHGVTLARTNLEKCSICIQAKMTRAPSPATNTVYTPVGEMVSAEVYCPGVDSVSRISYCVNHIDCFSPFVWSIPLRMKDADSVLRSWVRVVAAIQTDAETPVRAIQTDNGSGFVNELFR